MMTVAAEEERRFVPCLQCSQHCYQNHGQGFLSSRSPSFYSFFSQTPPSLPPALCLPSPSAVFHDRSSNFELFDKHLHCQAQLQGPSGQVWPVSIAGDLSFTEGWEVFAKDHGLEEGDLLIFKLLQDGIFSVSIYGSDLCEKTDALIVKNSGTILARTAQSFSERSTGKGNVHRIGWDDDDPKRRKVMPITPLIIDLDDDDDGDKDSDVIVLPGPEPITGHSAQGAQVGASPSSSLSNEADFPNLLDTTSNSAQGDQVGLQELGTTSGVGQEVQVPPSSRLSTDHVMGCLLEEKQGNSNWVELPHTPSNNEKLFSRMCMEQKVTLFVNQEAENCNDDPASIKDLRILLTKDYVTEAFVSKRRPVSADERQKALIAAKHFDSRQPHMRKVMRESHVYRGFWLAFPSDFSSEYLPQEIQQATLLDASGNAWSAKWLGRRSGLSGGWRKFSLDHGLEEGDVCIFELIDRKKLIIKVHIFRVVELANGLPGRDHYYRKPQSRPLKKITLSPTKCLKRPSQKIPSTSTTAQTPGRKMRGAITTKTASHWHSFSAPPKSNTRGGRETAGETSRTIKKLEYEKKIVEAEELVVNASKVTDSALVKTYTRHSLATSTSITQAAGLDVPNRKDVIKEEAFVDEDKAILNEAVINKVVLQNAGSKRSLISGSTGSELERSSPPPQMAAAAPASVGGRGGQGKMSAPCSRATDNPPSPPTPVNYVKRKLCREAAKQQPDHLPSATQTLSSKEASTGGKKYYAVERLFNRRKGISEEEFLVELERKEDGGSTLAPAPSHVQKEGSAWWVPLSHFTNDKLSCHL